MFKVLLSLALLVLGAAAQAIDSNSITVTATRSISLPAENVRFAISVTAPADSDLDSVTAALSSAGLRPVAFSGITNVDVFPRPAQLVWTFAYTVPFANFRQSLATLKSAAQAVSAKNRDLAVEFYPDRSIVSDAAVEDARHKLIPDLIADARKQAASIAAASGFSLGTILGVSEGLSGIPVIAVAHSGSSSSIGDFYGNGASAEVSTGSLLTVRFSAFRY